MEPGLGRPDREQALEQLCSQEEQRHVAALKAITDNCNAMRKGSKAFLFKFLYDLNSTTKSALQLMDMFTYPTEIIGKNFANFQFHGKNLLATLIERSSLYYYFDT